MPLNMPAINASAGHTHLIDYEYMEGAVPFAPVAHTHEGGASLPAGLICLWSGLLSAVPTGWVLCDGNNGTPNLLGSFIKGVATAGTDPGATGGATTHMHAGHDGHPLLVHSGMAVGDHAGHVFTQSNPHAFTQPGNHSGHVVTQPSAHIFTQPGAHSNHVVTQPSAHSNHVVTQPNDHLDVLNHVHRENRNSANTSGLDGWSAGDVSTNTPLLTGYSTANPTTGGVAAQVHAGGAVDAHSGHAGGAVDAHSGHAGGAVDAHSGTSTDAHSVHTGGAVDAHAGAGVDAHSVHGVTQASDHASQTHSAHDSVNHEPVYFALAFIMKT